MAGCLWRSGTWDCMEGFRGSVDGYFSTLGGRLLNPGLVGLQEVVFNGKLKRGAVRGWR